MPRSLYIVSPPPFLADTTVDQQPYLFFNHGNEKSSNSPPSSPPSSSVIVVLVVTVSAIIISASLYVLLRFLSRRFHRSFPTSSVINDVVPHNNNGNALNKELFDFLPLFTFRSVKITSGDCAVCLSKFEPQDQLRLLPLCCHAFHANCIDTWLTANQTCPLCRSSIYPADSDVVLNKTPSINSENHGNSFRVEIGNISRRRTESDSEGLRSYSIGSFEYVVDEGYEVPVEATHRRGVSECGIIDKDVGGVPVAPPGERLARQVSGGRSWLRDYVERIRSVSVSSRSVRSSGRFFSRSGSRNDAVLDVGDLESNRIGEEISELFRWLSGA